MRGRCLLQHLYPSIKVELGHSHAAPFGIAMSFLECDEISQFEKVNVRMLTNRSPIGVLRNHESVSKSLSQGTKGCATC